MSNLLNTEEVKEEDEREFEDEEERSKKISGLISIFQYEVVDQIS